LLTEALKTGAHTPPEFFPVNKSCSACFDLTEPAHNFLIPGICRIGLRWFIQTQHQVMRQFGPFGFREPQYFRFQGT
jgi:hypothetical protein